MIKKIKTFLLLCILACVCSAYQYEYHVPPINAANNAVERNNRGIMYMEMGQYAAAMNEFKIAISLNPESPASASYYNNLGLLYMKIGYLSEAQDCFLSAIKLNPVFLEYYNSLMKVYKQSGQLNNALKVNLAEIAKDNKNSHAYLMCGLIYKELGNKQQAINYLSKFNRLEKKQIMTRATKQMVIDLKNSK